MLCIYYLIHTCVYCYSPMMYLYREKEKERGRERERERERKRSGAEGPPFHFLIPDPCTQVWKLHKEPGFAGEKGIPGVEGRPGRSSVIGPGGYAGEQSSGTQACGHLCRCCTGAGHVNLWTRNPKPEPRTPNPEPLRHESSGRCSRGAGRAGGVRGSRT